MAGIRGPSPGAAGAATSHAPDRPRPSALIAAAAALAFVTGLPTHELGAALGAELAAAGAGPSASTRPTSATSARSMHGEPVSGAPC